MLNLSVIWITRKSEQEDQWLLESLLLLKEFDVEKIIVGHTDLNPDEDGFRYIPFHEHGLDELGLICHKKNIGVLAATREYCLVLHADACPDIEWLKTFNRFVSEVRHRESGETVVCPIGIMPNGERALTWCSYAGKSKPALEEYSDGTYISGGAIFGKREIFLKYRWDQNRRHNEEEDFYYSKLLHSKGVYQYCDPLFKVNMKNSQ